MVALAFKSENTINSKLIQWWTKSNYSHVEIIIDDYWVSSSPDQGGAYIHRLRPLSDNWDYVTVKVNEENTPWAIQFANAQVGTKYDWLGVFFSQFLHINKQDNSKWFCSELVTVLLQIMDNKQTKNLVPNEQSPGNLYRLYRMDYDI